MRDTIVSKFVSAGYDEVIANQCVDVLYESMSEQAVYTLFTGYDAVYNRECDGRIDIMSIETGEIVNSIYEYVGELRHYGSSVSRLYSLVYDSMMSIGDILGN